MRVRAAGLLSLAALAGCGGKAPPPAPAPAPTLQPEAQPPTPPAPVPGPPVAPPRARLRTPVRLAFVGDINLGTLSLRNGVPPDSGRALLDAARPALAGDLVVGNFEGALGDSGVTYKCGTKGRAVGFQAQRDSLARPDTAPPPPRRRRRAQQHQPPARPGCYAFLTPPELAPRLAEAGFTHLNLANNHANDFGPAGRATTDSAFASLGIRLYGPVGSIAVDSIRRGDSLTIVGLIGFATYPFAYDLLDLDRSVAVVDSLRPLVDLLVVTFHGGAEGTSALHTGEAAESLGAEPRGDLRRWARTVIDAGADAVVGHGPHVLRGIEYYRGAPVVYSLGNFFTYRGFNLSGPLGVTAVLQLDWAPGGGLSARLMPMVQQPGAGPAPDTLKRAIHLVRRLSDEDFPATGAFVSPDGRITPLP